MKRHDTHSIYSLRKTRFGLVSTVVAASLIFGTILHPIQALAEVSENTEKVTSSPEDDAEIFEDSLMDIPDFGSENSSEKSGTELAPKQNDAVSEEVVAPDQAAEEDQNNHAESKVLENSLDIFPVKPGDRKIEGKTYPNCFVLITVDLDSKTSFEKVFNADKDGYFSYELDQPLLYNQMIKIESYRPEIMELDDVEGGDVEKTVYTDRHPEAAPVPKVPLQKDENGRHQLQVEPIFEGSKIIKGYTSVKGTLYVSIDSSFVSKAIPITEGRFETRFTDTLDIQTFRKGDNVRLHFISEDGVPIINYQEVRAFGETQDNTPKGFTYNSLRSSSRKLEGVTEPMSLIHLYHVTTGEFIDEAIADENGNYQIDLDEDLHSGQAYYRVFINPNNKYLGIARQVVDQPEKDYIMSESMVSTILDDLETFAGQELPKDEEIALQDIHDEKVHIVGRTRYANSILKIKSSNPNKQFPPLQVDELGFWGMSLRDTDLQFELGEMITFEVIHPETFEILATKTVPVRHLSDEDLPEEQPLIMPAITTDTGYIEGTVAPNLDLEVRFGGKDEVIARGRSDANGKFSIDFGDRVFKAGTLLSFSGINHENLQTIWKMVHVTKGTGNRITKPIEEQGTPEVKTEPEKVLPEEKEMHESPQNHAGESQNDTPKQVEESQNSTPKSLDEEKQVAEDSMMGMEQNQESLKSVSVMPNPVSKKVLPKTSGQDTGLLSFIGATLLMTLGLATVSGKKKENH